MRWSELPEEYRALEGTFDKSDFELRWKDTESICLRFVWDETPQKGDFWAMCHWAKSINELPEIPKL